MRQRIVGLAGPLVAILFVAFTAPAGAQDISARALDLEIGARFQTQIVHSSVGGGPGVQGIIRRARITLDGTVNDVVDGRLQVEKGGVLKDAYLRVSLDPAFQVSMGKFKRAFDLFELQSSARINVERDGRVPGLDVCGGVGGICSYSRLTEKLEYSARDVGVRVAGDLSDRLSYLATLTNGVGGEGDVNDAKSAAGRVVLGLTESLGLGANVTMHDYKIGEDGFSEFATAWGLDLELGGFATPGLHLQAGVVDGENWRLLDGSNDPRTFLTGQGIVSWYAPSDEGDTVVGVEPLLRVSWADANTDFDDDEGLLLTPGFWVHLGNRNKIGVTADVYSHGDAGTVDAGGAEWSLKVFSHLYF